MTWHCYPNNNNDVFAVVFPVYLIGRCFGFLPFSINVDKKTKISFPIIRLIDWLWFFIVLAIFCIYLYYNFRTDYHSSGTDSMILVVSGRLILIVGFFMGIFGIIMDMFNRNCIWSIITKFHEFDEEVN